MHCGIDSLWLLWLEPWLVDFACHTTTCHHAFLEIGWLLAHCLTPAMAVGVDLTCLQAEPLPSPLSCLLSSPHHVCGGGQTGVALAMHFWGGWWVCVLFPQVKKENLEHMAWHGLYHPTCLPSGLSGEGAEAGCDSRRLLFGFVGGGLLALPAFSFLLGCGLSLL